ncbi:hypothetical protein BT93_E2132 [Corymbia citriodora subsp. variegata]|nr:hypothetical protein BT93_E2132 [Corymbia citriodora subsp. variegata]
MIAVERARADLDMFFIRAEIMRKKKRMAEIEKVKRRREEKVRERAQLLEEMHRLARERAGADRDTLSVKAAIMRRKERMAEIEKVQKRMEENARKMDRHLEEMRACSSRVSRSGEDRRGVAS